MSQSKNVYIKEVEGEIGKVAIEQNGLIFCYAVITKSTWRPLLEEVRIVCK